MEVIAESERKLLSTTIQKCNGLPWNSRGPSGDYHMKTSYQIPLRGIIGTMGLLLAIASPAFAQSSPGKIVQTSGSYCQNCDQGGYCDHCQGGCNHW